MDRVTLVHSNFDRVSEILAELDIPGVDGMLFDLGVSSPQLDDASVDFPICMTHRWTCGWMPPPLSPLMMCKHLELRGAAPHFV